MNINPDILQIIDQGHTEDNLYFLPSIQLDRKTYVAVNKVLENLGGKWSRKQKAHLFDTNVSDRIDNVLLTGEMVNPKKEWQFFETPHKLAQQLVDMANIQPWESVLEPSAGKGAIARIISEEPPCDCIEMNPENREYLLENKFSLVGDDFLQWNKGYDVIVANPPFTKQQDITHVLHMIKLARRRVVSVMSASVLFRTNKKTTDFTQLIDDLGGTIDPLPDDSFKVSGTRVKTCVLCVDVGYKTGEFASQ